MFNYSDASLEEQQSQIAVSIEQAESIVKTRDQIQKLFNNKLFKEIIVEGYFKDEAARLASIYNSPQLDEKQNKEVHDQFAAIGSLRRYLNIKVMMGDSAETELADHKQVQEELNSMATDEDVEGEGLESYIPE